MIGESRAPLAVADLFHLPQLDPLSFIIGLIQVVHFRGIMNQDCELGTCGNSLCIGAVSHFSPLDLALPSPHDGEKAKRPRQTIHFFSLFQTESGWRDGHILTVALRVLDPAAVDLDPLR